MSRRILVGLCVILGLIGVQTLARAEDDDAKGKQKGHLTAVFTGDFQAKCHLKPGGGDDSGKDQIHMSFTETWEEDLVRYGDDNPYFTGENMTWKSTVSAEGGGEFVDKGIVAVTWTFAPQQFTSCLSQLGDDTHGPGGEWGWVAWIGDFIQHGYTRSHQTKALSTDPEIAALAKDFDAGPVAPLCGRFILKSGGTPPALPFNPVPEEELAYRFTVPKNLKVATTFGGVRSKTSDEPPGNDWEGSSSITIHYSIHITPPGVTEPDKPQVELQEIDKKWLPEDKNSVSATVKVTGDDPEAFRVTLYDVSKEPGTCCNSKDDKTDPDLSFAKAQVPWDVEQKGDQWIATNDNGGKSATVQIDCHDWGAWGKLKAEAKIKDEWKPAKVAGTGYDFIRIPYDQDDDHIADAWQEDNNASGKAAKDDDDDRPEGQGKDGDGMSVYEEYRGFMVGAAGQSEHKRLDPHLKEIFVIDEGGIFDTGVWESASGIRAYLVDPALTQAGGGEEAAHVVNIHSSNAHNGNKYAVVVHAIGGGGGDAPDGLLGETNWPVNSPKDVTFCRVYVDRIRKSIGSLATDLGIAAAQPNSQEAQNFAALGLPAWLLKRAADKMSPGYQEMLAQHMIRLAAIHEMGHACALPGHCPDGSTEEPEGNRSCPMRYASSKMGLRYIILQVLMKPGAPLPMAYSKFCKDADFNCWSHFCVKDN